MREFGKGKAISRVIADEALLIAFAESFHFTPSQVRDLTVFEVEAFAEYLTGKGFALKQAEAKSRLRR